MSASAEELTIVAFGDSITHGVGNFGVTEETTFRGRLQRALTSRLARPVRVRNAGVGGDITPLARDRLDRDVLRHQPALVTVLFGVNDAGYYRPATNDFAETPRVTRDEFHQCLEAILIRLRAGGTRSVLLTPLPMNRHYWGTHLRPYVEHGLNFLVSAYAQTVRDLAAQHHVPLVDTYAYFESHPETVDRVPDGIHPDPGGHELLAALLVPVVYQALQEPAGQRPGK